MDKISNNDLDSPKNSLENNTESNIEIEYENQHSFYSYSDPHGRDIILETYNRSGIQKHLIEFEEEGFTFSSEYSFVQEGYGIPESYEDSVLVQFITIAMVNSSDPTRAAYLLYSTCELGSIVSKYKLSFVEPDPDEDFDFITDGIWRFNYPSVIYYDKKQTSISSDETIYSYLDCVENGTAAGCSTALIVCAFSGPGYPACIAAGCASAFVASAILCLFTEL